VYIRFHRELDAVLARIGAYSLAIVREREGEHQHRRKGSQTSARMHHMQRNKTVSLAVSNWY
jgi:hypothetical protein